MDSAPDLRERNIGLVFDALDTDRDGYITEDDLVAAGHRALDAFGITDAGLRAEILGMSQSAWQRLRADCDSDGDGRVSRAEHTAAYTAGLGGPQAYYQQLTGPIVDRYARLIDQDGDGFIEAGEYARLFASHGVDEGIARAAFERLDADADGKISVAEFSDAIGQLMLSQDPADPGTVVLGPS
jgi:Ca2+-binding EF-hand superfamily protein